MFENTSFLILIIVVLIACAVAAIFINRYLSLKEKTLKDTNGNIDISIIEQATNAKNLQEQVEALRDELDSIEHQYNVFKENASNEKLALVQEVSNLKSENQNLKEKITERENYIKALKEEHEQKINDCQNNYEQIIKEIKDSNDKLFANQTSTLKENIKKLEIDLLGKTAELKQANDIIQNKSVAETELKSQNSTLELLRKEDQKRFEQSQSELEHRLNTMSEKILKDRTESLQKLNSQSMAQIINPLQNELNTFRTMIANTQKSNSEQAGILQNELKHLHEAQQSLGEQAQNLSKALLQGSKSQGIWGEQQLELVLQASGLTNEQNYIKECFATNDQGDKGRADVLILLPQNRGLVIDSKCSLTAYTEACNAENDNDTKAYEQAIARHIDSVKKHIDELHAKQYPSFERYGSPNFVFMFVPIDNALALALRNNDKLYNYAQEKNVYLVSPSSLLPALRIVGNLWALANQGDKFRTLVKSADKIYQKCSKICNDFESILKSRDSLNKNIDQMSISLLNGKGNLKSMLYNFSVDAPALTDKALLSFEQDLKAFDQEATSMIPLFNNSTNAKDQEHIGSYIPNNLVPKKVIESKAPDKEQAQLTAFEALPSTKSESEQPQAPAKPEQAQTKAEQNLDKAEPSAQSLAKPSAKSEEEQATVPTKAGVEIEQAQDKTDTQETESKDLKTQEQESESKSKSEPKESLAQSEALESETKEDPVKKIRAKRSSTRKTKAKSEESVDSEQA